MNRLSIFFAGIVLSAGLIFAQSPVRKITVPNPAQLRYQQYEQIMFLCLDPYTWLPESPQPFTPVPMATPIPRLKWMYPC